MLGDILAMSKTSAALLDIIHVSYSFLMVLRSMLLNSDFSLVALPAREAEIIAPQLTAAFSGVLRKINSLKLSAHERSFLYLLCH